ncbi:Hypothetical protein CINCED_3A016034 [Cinara cedri]|uniref:Uncharacterized protein n=1 Tax=Cinara cedri TaxID=506608 RepID=A0A5E4MAL9_9HEMI|nr:Hypothetical protein CINCED_3A016034 [Cinara cedri]
MIHQYANTVRVARKSCNSFELNTKVMAMRRTRANDLLIVATADKLRGILVDRLGSQTGAVSKLVPTILLEVLDLDAVTTSEEVIEAICAAVPEDDGDLDVATNKASVTVTSICRAL